MKKLPIGISTLEKIRNDEYVYVDKTPHVVTLANTGSDYFFLSRPRRFGKSLLIDTLKQAFLGNKTLFKGLYLENHWDWEITYPVIHFSFGAGSAYKSRENLEALIDVQLDKHAKLYDVTLTKPTRNTQFDELIRKVCEKTGQKVVILVDEYDKPILDVINEPEKAKENREILKGLYSAIKDLDASLRFVFLTGVSKFAKVSVFSGLNNLDDITLNPFYADICGYTQSEMEVAFKQHLSHGKVDRVKLKHWYNGYNFSGLESQKVYNPFDILLFCNNSYRYKNYWFETATPTFLIKLLHSHKQSIPKFESFKVTDESLLSFDVDNLPIHTLLFQTGYLTIKKIITIGDQYAYELTYPNLEVKSSLNAHLMQLGSTPEQKNETFLSLSECMNEGDFDTLKTIFNTHFSSIPHDWYRNNPIGQYEGFYAGIVYSCFAALGYEMCAEDPTSAGRIDLTIQMPDKILILEFKLSKYGTAVDAIKQIKDKKYADKFKSDKRPIYLIGMSFDEQTKTMQDLLWETV